MAAGASSVSYDNFFQWRQWKILSSVIGFILIPLVLLAFFLLFAIDSTSLTRSELLVISSSSSSISSELVISSSSISSPPSLPSPPTSVSYPSPPPPSLASPPTSLSSPSPSPSVPAPSAHAPASSLPVVIPPALPPAQETPKIPENPLPEMQKIPEIPRIEEGGRGSITTCDIFNGRWVYDESLPYYPVKSCPYVDEFFDCHGNGRKDTKYLKYKWKPYDCDLPDFDGKTLLKLLSGKKLIIAGDSMNRSMWVSLVCLIWQSVDNKTMLEDVRGTRAVFVKEYNCTVEFITSVFLAQIERKVGFNETVRLDMFEQTLTPRYKSADFIVFNTGHWWTDNKVNSGKNFFREGDHVYPKLDLAKACKKAFRTWGKWLDQNIDSNKTQVFFAGYTANHYDGRQWKLKGGCLGETEPIMNDSHVGHDYHWTMKILESQLKRTKTPVYYLNITRMTDFRKDAHTMVYRISPNRSVTEQARKASDCGHWCIPGVPDSWNFLLYAVIFNRQRSINGGVL